MMQLSFDPAPAPDGKLLSAEDRAAIESRLAQRREPLAERVLSDYTFDNLYLFRAAHGYSYLPGEHPCVSGHTYDGTSHLLPLFDIATTPLQVLQELLGSRDCFYPLPAPVVAQLDPGAFELAASRDDSDYLYAAENFIEYESRPLRGQRSSSAKLRLQQRIRHCDIRHDSGEDALQVLAQWSAEKGLSDDAADGMPCCEAIQSQLGPSSLSGTVYYVDDKAAGFLLTEPLNPGVLVVRFAKGLKAFDGIYPLMFQELCRRHDRSVRWLNFEQDMGRMNFRKAKLSYAPCDLLEKFRVRPRHRQAPTTSAA
jgi:hypothetical protein